MFLQLLGGSKTEETGVVWVGGERSCSRARQRSASLRAGPRVPSWLPEPGAGGVPAHWLLRGLAPTALSPSPGPRGSLAFEKGLSLCSGSLPTPAPPQLHFLSSFPGILTAASRGGREAEETQTGPCLLSAAEPEGACFLVACTLEEAASVDVQPPDLAPPLGALCNTPAPPRGTRTWGMRQPQEEVAWKFLSSPKCVSGSAYDKYGGGGRGPRPQQPGKNPHCVMARWQPCDTDRSLQASEPHSPS